MHFLSLLFITSFLIFSFRSNVLAQQPYIGRRATISCTTNNTGTSNTSDYGFTCNGLKKRCQAYLIYRAIPPYNSVSSISQLLASDPSQLSSINSVPENTTFATNKMVIVPVNCSCAGKYYQTNTSYTVKRGDTYYLIINSTLQGLTTCKAIKKQNNIFTKYLYGGPITVPLRCACPTKNQTDQGVKYLLTYVVSEGNYVATICERFGANVGIALQANKLTEDSNTIYPYTTLLVPLPNRPTSNQTIEALSPTSQPSSPPPTTSSPKKVSDRKWLYALGGYLVGSVSMLAFGSVVFYICFWRKAMSNSAAVSTSPMEKEKKLSDEEAQGIIKNISATAQSLKVYDFKDLLSGTDNFGPNSLIKGSVYRGKIDDVPVAIKKMDGDITKEISILNKINHINLIHLLGICFDDGHWYLVYEYAVNGSLSDWICYADKGGRFLTWSQRIQIAVDVATGLNYLHSFANPPYIHKNLTSSNVLLESDFRAKISNLSLAKSGEGQGHPFTLTSHIVGTKGYLAPEYLEHGLVSTKLDVYAFGVLMMEIITGKEVASLYGSENMHLYDILLPVLCEDGGHEKLAGLIDPSLEGNYPNELATLLIELVGSCLDKNPSSRPEIDEVGRFLVKILSSSIAWESSKNNSTI